MYFSFKSIFFFSLPQYFQTSKQRYKASPDPVHWKRPVRTLNSCWPSHLSHGSPHFPYCIIIIWIQMWPSLVDQVFLVFLIYPYALQIEDIHYEWINERTNGREGRKEGSRQQTHGNTSKSLKEPMILKYRNSVNSENCTQQDTQLTIKTGLNISLWRRNDQAHDEGITENLLVEPRLAHLGFKNALACLATLLRDRELYLTVVCRHLNPPPRLRPQSWMSQLNSSHSLLQTHNHFPLFLFKESA